MNIEELSDIKLESGIIGTLIVHPDYIAHSDYLKPNYFFGKDNACVYWAIQELVKKGITTIDAYNVFTQIQSNNGVAKTLEKYNFPSVEEFINLYRQVARNSLEEYRMLVDKVVGFAFRRDLIATLNQIDNDCYSKDIDLTKLSNETYNKLDALTKKYVICDEVKTIGEQLDGIWAEIVSRRTADGVFGLPSKFPSFNEYFTYEPGELVVVQAKYKQGKSVFLMNEVVHKLRNGVACLVIDSEMPTRLYTERLIAHLSGVDIRRIKSGEMTKEEELKVTQEMLWLKEQPLVHIYETDTNMDKIYSLCKMLQNKMNLGFVVFDYLKSNESDSSTNYNLLGAYCDYLKNKIAGNLNLSVLAAAQLNRQGEVADSMKINRYLSVGIKWEYKTQEMIAKDGPQCGNAYAKVYVNRLGRQMPEDDENQYIDFIFDGSTQTIVEAQKHNGGEQNEELF